MKTNLQKIFFCTGARNHDILEMFPDELVHFEFDERMASFKALGLSKISKLPVAICTTSGTAVSQCTSAMLEAYYSNLPLVLITGDRPKKMHSTGAPQTICHEKLTLSCRRTFIEIDIKDFKNLSLEGVEYPVHINVLIDDTISHDLKTHHHTTIDSFAHFLKTKKKPLFLFSHEEISMRPLIHEFSKRNLTFYAESLSFSHDLSNIKTEKKLLELFQAGFFDSVVRIGHTPLSKVWRLLERTPLPVFHFDSRNLAGLSYGEILPMNSDQLLNSSEFWKALDSLSPYPIGDETIWKLDDLIKKFPDSEISYINALQNHLNENDIVYLGNSLIVRFFELTQKKPLEVYGNRGVNGIDGQLASAIGLAMGTTKTVTCILGDITTFYDLSSLREMPDNLRLIVINNRGGRIFDMLKLDKRIVLEHENNFKDIASALGLSYGTTMNNFGRVKLLELFPQRSETDQMLKEWAK